MRAQAGRGWWRRGGITEPHLCFQERLSSHPSIKHSPLFPPRHPAWSIHPPLLFSSLLLLFPLAIPAGESAYRVTLVNRKRHGATKEWEGRREGTISTQLKERRRQQEPWGVGVGVGMSSSWVWLNSEVGKKKTHDDDGRWEKFKVWITASIAELKLWSRHEAPHPPSTKKAPPAQQIWPISMGRGATRGLCGCNFPLWQTASLHVAALTFLLRCWQFYCNEKYTNAQSYRVSHKE